MLLLYLQYPELNAMIMRRFSEPGDVERAYDAVLKVRDLFKCYILLNVFP